MLGLKRDIIYDLDGTFTSAFDGSSRSSAAIVYSFPHLEQESACLPATTASEWDSTLACDQTVTIRRVMFTNIEPDYTFKWTPLKAQVLADVDEEVPENSTDYT